VNNIAELTLPRYGGRSLIRYYCILYASVMLCAEQMSPDVSTEADVSVTSSETPSDSAS